MNALEAALVDVADYLVAGGIPYMVIGGFANLRWGKPRLTEDLDVKVRVEERDWPEFMDGVAARFEILVPRPLDFVRDTRVLPIRTPTGVRADLVIAELPYEHEAMRRAATIEVAGRPVRITTAEDLVLHKIISDRTRDRDDVEGVIMTQGKALDRGYLDVRVKEMAEGLERPEILTFYRTCLEKAGIGGDRSQHPGGHHG